MIDYHIKTTSTGIWQEFALSLFLCLFFVIPSFFFFGLGIGWIFLAISVYLFRLTVYSLSDFLFDKKIFKDGSHINLQMGCYRFLLSNESYLAIVNSPVPGRYGFKHYQLILVRNSKKLGLSKNRIRLYPEDGDLDLVGIAKKIEQMFQIEYRGVIDVGGSEKDLLKNKGIIP